MSGVLDVGALDDRTRAGLKRHITSLADSKRLLGIRYSDWNLGAPTVETGIAMSSMTQDEWGHARLLYAMLKELEMDPVAVEHERAAEEYANLPTVDTEFPNWAAAVAGVVIADGAVSVALDEFSRGSFEPARTRVPKMLAEEEFHASLGSAWFRRLADASGEAKSLLAEATAGMLPEVLAWLGSTDDASRALEAAGVIGDPAQAVDAFRDASRDLLALADIDVGSFEAAAEWDSERGRGPGHPDEETVGRARGDRNRALFVE